MALGATATDDDVGIQGVASTVGLVRHRAGEGPVGFVVGDLGAGESRRGDDAANDVLHGVDISFGRSSYERVTCQE